jgi:Protein kinase domain
VNTFHRLDGYFTAHGSLTPHNIFVAISHNQNADAVKVKIDGFEMVDLKKYANMFYNYRNASVYSPPEVLKQLKKVLEPQGSVDAYSFGLVMWEVYHGIVPFDGSLSAAVQCVVVENLRPKIREAHDEGEDRSQNSNLMESCSAPIAELIRQCWDSDPALRPDFSAILGVLWHETTYFSKCDTDFDVSVDSFEVIVEE